MRDEKLGIVVPFGDSAALRKAITEALRSNWDRELITAYAMDNDWDKRVAVLLEEFVDVFQKGKSVDHG